VSARPTTTSFLRFGAYEFEPRAGELRKQGIRIRLEGQPLAILTMLLDRPGELVTRDDLQRRLWPADTFVDFEHSLNAAIKRLRAALNDSASAPRYIETLPGRGYRFMAPIAPPPAPAVAHASGESPGDGGSQVPSRLRGWPLWLAIAGALLAVALTAWGWRELRRRNVSAGSAPLIRSLAVLPLENLSGDASQEYFADGLTDALITDLAQIGALRVISRTSVMRYKGMRRSLPDVARELGVDGIVEGTVVRSNSRVRITSQLIYAPADQHLWARSYERDIGDVVTLQSEVAQAIAGEVRATVTPEEHSHLTKRPTESSEAYQLYLQGRYFWNQRTPRGTKKSIEFFQQAVEKDPNFALAYAGLADAYNFGNILRVSSPKENSPKAKAAATRALVLDPQLAEAHAALGLAKSHYDFDFPGAQKEFLRAIELNPNYANAHLFYAGGYLTPMGRHEEAIAEMKKALELDPFSLPLNNIMGSTYLWAGDYQKSLQQFLHTINLDPAFPLAHFYFAGLLAEVGRYEEAIDEKQQGQLLTGVSPEEAYEEAAEFHRAFKKGGPRGYWRKNLEATLKAQKKGGTGYFAAVDVAGAYARIGNKESAFRWLEKAYEERSITLLRWLPDFKTLHGDPRFADLLTRMGLPN
jgi:TolB-like protein/DNA-binding winged helix-turn-helix (wHTH) protein/tetratricopeptide (TPR) repeat protein